MKSTSRGKNNTLLINVTPWVAVVASASAAALPDPAVKMADDGGTCTVVLGAKRPPRDAGTMVLRAPSFLFLPTKPPVVELSATKPPMTDFSATMAPMSGFLAAKLFVAGATKAVVSNKNGR